MLSEHTRQDYDMQMQSRNVQDENYGVFYSYNISFIQVYNWLYKSI